MSGRSQKKDNEKRSSRGKKYIIAIISVTILYILINAYMLIYKDHEVTKSQIFGFCFLTVMNVLLYKLLDFLMDSMWENYIIDVLGLNLAVEILVNFHWKFWFLYLIYPCYFLYLGGLKTYEYVKTIGKEDPNEPQGNIGPNKPERPKQKIVKVKN